MPAAGAGRAVAEGGGTAPEQGPERRLTSAAGLLLVVAVAVGLVGQGA